MTSILVRGIDDMPLPERTGDVAITAVTLAVLVSNREAETTMPFDDSVAERSAAICRAHGATCATLNSRDFTGSGVKLVDPWAA